MLGNGSQLLDCATSGSHCNQSKNKILEMQGTRVVRKRLVLIGLHIKNGWQS